MIRELDENELLVRAFFRPAKQADAEHVLRPADFERRRKPIKKRDDNGLSLSRLTDANSEGSSELPQEFRDKFSNSPSYVGFATASVRDLRSLGYRVVADEKFHVSLFCEFCDITAISEVCEALDSRDCSVNPGTDMSLRQKLAITFKIETTIKS